VKCNIHSRFELAGQFLPGSSRIKALKNSDWAFHVAVDQTFGREIGQDRHDDFGMAPGPGFFQQGRKPARYLLQDRIDEVGTHGIRCAKGDKKLIDPL